MTLKAWHHEAARCPKCGGIMRDDGDYSCVNCRVETLVGEMGPLINEFDSARLRLKCIKDELEKQLERLSVNGNKDISIGHRVWFPFQGRVIEGEILCVYEHMYTILSIDGNFIVDRVDIYTTKEQCENAIMEADIE